MTSLSFAAVDSNEESWLDAFSIALLAFQTKPTASTPSNASDSNAS